MSSKNSKDSCKNLLNNELDESQTNCASLALLKSETHDVRREEGLRMPQTESKKSFRKDKGLSGTLNNKASFISNFDPKSPEMSAENSNKTLKTKWCKFLSSNSPMFIIVSSNNTKASFSKTTAGSKNQIDKGISPN